ncbi:uncharacterized protein G2W53_000825 [Senna tora]|uniref:Uncharacterized protein n=1 Tax=Senna tora TaxID=362788 RepID=A0A834XGC7_9FABA|nr:uncharacterized protein G2W53_000825 [Senna tora]
MGSWSFLGVRNPAWRIDEYCGQKLFASVVGPGFIPLNYLLP